MGDLVAVQDASVLARVRSQLHGYTGALQRVAAQVISDPPGAARATIVELAERSGTSPASVTRFCRALGFDGYAELRFALASETGRGAAVLGRASGWTEDAHSELTRRPAYIAEPPGESSPWVGREIEPGDPLDRVLGQLMAADTQAMRDTAAMLDLAEVERAADAIVNANRIDIYGASGSALVGAEMQLSLNRLGLAAWSWLDVHNGLASAALLRSGDVAIGISHSGRTRETVEMLAEAGSRGAVTIALTGYPSSPLAELADLVLRTAAQGDKDLPRQPADTAEPPRGSSKSPTTYRPESTARHLQLMVLDLLYIGVAQRTQVQTI